MIARAANPDQDQSYDNLTALYFCDGAIAGLVAITPGAGFVRTPSEYHKLMYAK